MAPITHLLATTDFSAAGDDAVRRAARLALALGAKLELLHVVPESWLREMRAMLPGGDELARAVAPEAQRKLEALAASLPAGGERATCIVETGSPPEIIAGIAAWHDLVVAGAHGSGATASTLLGSTSERALRRSTRPWLVTRTAPDRDYRRVVAAIDFSPSSRDALAFARLLVPEAAFTLVHALDVEFEGKLNLAGVSGEPLRQYRELRRSGALPRLRAMAAQGEEVVADYGFPARVILDNAARVGADLVVAGKRGQSAVADLLLGSVARRLLAEATTDVLV